MARYDESTNGRLPEQTVNPGDMLGYRHHGDNIASPYRAARLQAFNPTTIAYQDVIIDDATGGVVTSGGGGGGGGTQYAEDTAHTAAELLNMAGVVRKDVAASLVGTDSDRTELIVDADGKLWANVGTVAITAAALPLPSGAATSANQTTVIGHLDGVEGLLTTIDGDTGGMLTALQILDNIVSGSEAQVDVVAALPAGTNNIGDVDLASAIPAGSNLIGRVAIDAQTANGCDIFKSLDLDETEEQVKATAGTLYGWAITNRRTSTLWLKFYNDTAANVIVGTTVPVLTFGIPGNATDNVGANMLGGQGIAFGTAITVAATTGFADADTGAPGANELIVNIFFK